MSISRLPQAWYLIFSIAAGMAGPAHAQISDGSIKVGVITDMNGPLSSATGRGSVEAARMAAEEFGFSINGRRIEILTAHGLAASSPGWFRSCLDHLIEDGVALLHHLSVALDRIECVEVFATDGLAAGIRPLAASRIPG